MISDFEHNLCTYYLLPLIRLGPTSFGVGPSGFNNFLDSYVNKTGYSVYIRLEDLECINPDAINGYFQGFKDSFAVYAIPNRFHKTVELFKKGKYGDFPSVVKAMIRNYSGLTYNKLDSESGYYISHPLILALDRPPGLRERLEKELDVKLPKDADVISIPADSNYVFFNEFASETTPETNTKA